MFKLIFSLGLVLILLPDDLEPTKPFVGSEDTQMASVSTFDTLSAAHNIYEDISNFCERNVETCLTGQALATNLTAKARSAISSLTTKTQGKEISSQTDEIVTGSIRTPAQ